MSVIYPLCYKGNDWNSIPYACGPGKGLTYAQFGYGKELEAITGWADTYPLTWESQIRSEGTWQGPPVSGMGGVPAPPAKEGFLTKLGEGVRSFFRLADKGLDTAHLWGVVTVAAIGGGLLLYYVPRRRR